KLQSKVSGITNYGAIIEIKNRKSGLVHISEIADTSEKDIKEHLTVRDEIKVKSINEDDEGKIGVSIKNAKASTGRHRNTKKRTENFESKMNRFLKDSEERLASLKKNTESRRGGRGAKRG